jgi:hypothetical protein
MNETAKDVFGEGIEREQLRELERMDELPDPDSNTYMATRKPDNLYTWQQPPSIAGPIYSLPTKAMYKHAGGQKPKDYAKKKKTKCRQQKQSKKMNRK